MKRPIFFLLAIGITAALSAQIRLPEHNFASGNWSVSGGRAYQNDENARLARVNIRAPQRGSMLYEFTARYEGGSEDGHGGFGIHIFADSVVNRASWGVGNSYLLWLNYDERPIANSGIHAGLSGQIYRSFSHSRMELLHSVDLNEYIDLLTPENLAEPVTFMIWVNGDTGEIRVYDPSDAFLSTYYYFHINQRDLPLRGDWVSIRTNGLKMSFAPAE